MQVKRCYAFYAFTFFGNKKGVQTMKYDQFTKNMPWMMPMVNPEHIQQLQTEFTENFRQLMLQASQGSLPPVKDRRFSSEAWQQNPQFSALAHLYLLSASTMNKWVEQLEIPDASRERLRFSITQWLDAFAPSNFFALNPDALKAFQESKGESLQKGMANLMHDLQKGRITQTDETVFEVGRNLAITEGSVVFENPYFQLIQYKPQTPTVHETPLLMVPPCINKYYILDLQPENSMVAYTVAQGHTVFLVSWRNPLPEDKDDIQNATWEDYIENGVLKAISVVSDISGKEKINALGFCVGGTMLACALAVARKRGQDPVAALSLLTTFLDFEHTGIMDVFVDEAHASLREQQLGQGGLLTAAELGTTFSFLRPNELVWNYVVNNYLKGQSPAAFDLLYWNADGTNLPGPFFTWYFRNTYLENNLKKPNYLSISGTPVDLGLLDMPVYIYASKDDHIVPWDSAYASTHILQGPKRFVLGASGHIAGVINPPAKNKRHYWVSSAETEQVFPVSSQWFDNTRQVQGSWWPDWSEWLASHAGKKVRAKKTAGNGTYPELESAPGKYVKVKAV